MKTKTSELTGAALDWAVARCEGGVGDNQLIGAWYAPSTDWSQGGPIIEREGMSVGMVNEYWQAHLSEFGLWEDGPTPLIAAMRCYVASKLSDEVEVPDELH
jgi:hypothetical protein